LRKARASCAFRLAAGGHLGNPKLAGHERVAPLRGGPPRPFAESAADAATMYDAGSFARLGEIRAQVDPCGLFRAKTHIPVG